MSTNSDASSSRARLRLYRPTRHRVALPPRVVTRSRPHVTPPRSLYARFGKRALDVVFGVVLMIVTAPVILTLALLVRLHVGAPVIYRQQRVGQDSRIFTIFKFRTMIGDRRAGAANEYDGPERRNRHKSHLDPRVTQLGRRLRTWSLDELPQLWNVLRGEMSLVGPRPELVEIVDRHYEVWQLERHRVKPGITGLWQISARGEGLIYNNVELDLDYIRSLSLATDVRILLETLGTVLGRGRGH